MDSTLKPKVCRVLFPSDEPSNDNYMKAIDESLQKHLEKQQKKWNFDIKEEKMLSENGTYVWTKGDGDRYDWIGRPNTEATEEEEEKKPKNEDQSDEPSDDLESNELQNGIEKGEIK